MRKCNKNAEDRMEDNGLDDEFDPEGFFVELKDAATSDRVILMKLRSAYKRLDQGWDMDQNDEDYLGWEYDFMSWITDRAEQSGWDIDSAVDDMKHALDDIVKTGRNYKEP